MARIVCVGSCNTDLVSYMESFPAPGETIFGSSFKVGFGGKGANQAVMAAKLSSGGEVAMVGAVGADSFGRDHLTNFSSLGISTDHISVLEGVSTGVAPIFVDAKGENSIVVVPGANARLTKEHVEAAGPLLDAASVLLVQLEIPHEVTLAALERVRGAGGVTILTPAPVPAGGLPPSFFSSTSILVANRVEAATLTSLPPIPSGTPLETALDSCAAMGRKLLEMGCGAVVMTLGGDGAVVFGPSTFTLIPPHPIPSVVDTTGAGDAFSGALAYHLSTRIVKGKEVDMEDIIKAAKYATIVAGLSVTRPGTQSSYPTRDEVEKEVTL